MPYFATLLLLLLSVMLLRLFCYLPTTTKHLHSTCHHSARQVWWSYSYILRIPPPIFLYLSAQDLKDHTGLLLSGLKGMTSPTHVTTECLTVKKRFQIPFNHLLNIVKAYLICLCPPLPLYSSNALVSSLKLWLWLWFVGFSRPLPSFGHLPDCLPESCSWSTT